VLRDGLERHVEGLGQLRYRAFFFGDPTQDFAPCRVGEGLENLIEVVGTRFNQ
jgi:hypothetical protein